jgi:hypothetical protein
MSAPETPAASGRHAETRPPGRARALNLVSIAAIATAIGLVAVAAVPAWIKTSPTVVSVDDMPAPLTFRAPGLPPPSPHPSFADDDDGPELEGLPPSPHVRSRRGDRSAAPDLPPGLPGGPESLADPMGGEPRPEVVQIDRDSQPRIGTARRAAALLAEPGDAARILGRVRANEQLMIVKEKGDWVFVLHGGLGAGAGEMGTGWLKKSEIAIR